MKKILLPSLLAICLFTTACNYLNDSTAVRADGSSDSMNANKAQSNQNGNTADKTKRNDADKYPRVWLGQISAENGRVFLRENVIWAFDEEFVNEKDERLFAKSEGADEFEADVMNCAGYLGAVKITRQNQDADWKLSLLPETVAADAAQKIKRCSGGAADGENVGSSAFAVAPRNVNRKNIRVGDIETRKLFASLPKDVQDFLNGKYALAAGRKKDELSLLQNDLWTDTDGDGKIDLLYYSAAYDEEHSGGGILYLSGDRWTEIGTVRD